MPRAVTAAVLLAAAPATGHGVMYEPPVRNSGGVALLRPGCSGGSCLWFNQGCSIGCPNATGKGSVVGPADCPNPAEPTIAYEDKRLRTYNVDRLSLEGDWTKTHPWRKPGSAPVEDPCGLAGGWYTTGAPGNGGEAPPGTTQGQHGSQLPRLLKQTTWIAGETAEVAWGIYANHGGGYQYRLCPAGEKLTEECFRKHPLEFADPGQQWLQFGAGMDTANRSSITAQRVSTGTVPAGSTWTKNPIPACMIPVAGGAFNLPCISAQFTPPLGLKGFGGGACGSGLPLTKCTPDRFLEQSFDFGIVDKVKVPQLPEGDYVLGFRWDSEQTPQVWTSCADVTIRAQGKAKATTPFSEWAGCDACCALPGAVPGMCSNCTKCANDKTGDCAYCWKALPGYNPSMVPPIQCLGFEAADGGAPTWNPGDERTGGWSPGCTKCWATPGSCQSSPRA
eukprot:TRINITY_DN2204_c0_g1_i1.p2 TRINITY_DN2204_c0_g1~~TRINITY_DN2204_c0_g1_i1.p2  ORF type:complete len:478 (+),score=132.39 TRINITY_DN2204_c0_g1_i1:90-1436(+)